MRLPFIALLSLLLGFAGPSFATQEEPAPSPTPQDAALGAEVQRLIQESASEGEDDPEFEVARQKRSRGPLRPADWKSYYFDLRDTRPDGTSCPIEVIKIKYDSPLAKRGAVLLVPGLLQNAFVFDLDAKNDVSYARWLMVNKGLQIYMLNLRGVGNSCYPKHSNLDDMAIDDVPQAIDFVAEKLEKNKIAVIGHSMGGILTQAALSGLTRCPGKPKKNCFDAEVAAERARKVLSAGVLGVDVSLSSSNPLNGMRLLGLLDYLSGPIARAIFIDRMPVSFYAKFFHRMFTPERVVMGKAWLGYWGVMKYFYEFMDTDEKGRNLFLRKALDATDLGVLRQYAQGMRSKGIENTSGEKYGAYLKFINPPFCQGSFGKDLFAEPELAKVKNFDLVGSEQKDYFVFADEGHEDVFLGDGLTTKETPFFDCVMKYFPGNDDESKRPL